MTENKSLELFKKITNGYRQHLGLKSFFDYFTKFALYFVATTLISIISIVSLWSFYLVHNNGLCIHFLTTALFCCFSVSLLFFFLLNNYSEVFIYNVFHNKKENRIFIFSLLTPFLYYHVIYSIRNNKNYRFNNFSGYYLNTLLKNSTFTELNCPSITDIKSYDARVMLTKYITHFYKTFTYKEIKSIKIMIDNNIFKNSFIFTYQGSFEKFTQDIKRFEKIKYQQELSKKINDFV